MSTRKLNFSKLVCRIFRIITVGVKTPMRIQSTFVPSVKRPIATLRSKDTHCLMLVFCFAITGRSWSHKYRNMSRLTRKFSSQSCSPKLRNTTSSHHWLDLWHIQILLGRTAKAHVRIDSVKLPLLAYEQPFFMPAFFDCWLLFFQIFHLICALATRSARTSLGHVFCSTP